MHSCACVLMHSCTRYLNHYFYLIYHRSMTNPLVFTSFLFSDINECLTLSPCDQECTNIPGSFTCTCNSGYLMTGATTCAGERKSFSYYFSQFCINICINICIHDSLKKATTYGRNVIQKKAILITTESIVVVNYKTLLIICINNYCTPLFETLFLKH